MDKLANDILNSACNFLVPQSAWVNRGVGGDTSGARIQGAMDYFRPPGTFSFTTGVVSFMAYWLLIFFISGCIGKR